MRIDYILIRTMNKCTNVIAMLKSDRLTKVTGKLKSTLEYAWVRDYNANVVYNAAYAGSIVFFLIGSLTPRLPKFSFPFAGSMYPTKTKFGKAKVPRTILAFMFCIHFMRRVLELLFVHRFKRELRILETFIGPLICWIFSIWMALSIRPAAGYVNANVVIYVFGMILLTFGECFSVCCYLHCTLEQKLCSLLQRFNMSLCELPKGFLLPFESGYHVTSETLCWFGFFIATGTLSALLFFLGNFAFFVIYLSKCYKERTKQCKNKIINGNTIFPINVDTDVILQLEC